MLLDRVTRLAAGLGSFTAGELSAYTGEPTEAILALLRANPHRFTDATSPASGASEILWSVSGGALGEDCSASGLRSVSDGDEPQNLAMLDPPPRPQTDVQDYWARLNVVERALRDLPTISERPRRDAKLTVVHIWLHQVANFRAAVAGRADTMFGDEESAARFTAKTTAFQAVADIAETVRSSDAALPLALGLAASRLAASLAQMSEEMARTIAVILYRILVVENCFPPLAVLAPPGEGELPWPTTSVGAGVVVWARSSIDGQPIWHQEWARDLVAQGFAWSCSRLGRGSPTGR